MTDQIVTGKLLLSQSTGLRTLHVEEDYDLVLGGLSWEARCLSAFENSPALQKPVTFVRFASADPAVAELKTAKINSFRSHGGEATELQLGKSTDFLRNSRQLEDFVLDLYVKLGRPLRLLLDITCLPKSYVMFLVGAVFSRYLVSRLDCVYSEGEYRIGEKHEIPSSRIDATAARGIISDGAWASQQIPYLESSVSIPDRRDVVVALGGEVALSLPFIEGYEPNHLALAMIAESVIQEPEKLIGSERAALIELLGEPNGVRWNIGLSNVKLLLERVAEFCKSSAAESITGIALGSKPHALGISLASLANEKLEGVVRIPAQYKPLDVQPNGLFGIYSIIDRFEPSAYF